MPRADDLLDVARRPGMRLTWLPRDGGRHGWRLLPAVRAAADRLFAVPTAEQDLPEVDVDTDILWEVPDPASAPGRSYAWLAGEAAMIRDLRRHLVTERGLDRAAVAFMGYWRLGRSEAAPERLSDLRRRRRGPLPRPGYRAAVDDRELVAAMLAGDPRGLEGAYRRYADRLYAYCRGVLHDADAAGDVVHDTFIIAAQRVGDLRDPARLRSWLYTVARHECLRALRRPPAVGLR